MRTPFPHSQQYRITRDSLMAAIKVEQNTEMVVGRREIEAGVDSRQYLVITGAGARKMKVATVDIFIYGCHKDTVPDDIVDELKFSDIDITKDDIEEKTREHSNVKSFKIAIKAEYLEKALKPETWPMRVKVREWVYYPKRKE